jgi:7-carboxy-7-deazaguanine synthase
MEKIKISEIFYSIQGEGRYMGVPSVFMRTFGCNFQCAGFGMPKGEKTDEIEPIVANIDLYKDYRDLPLVSKGCDSYASWHPAFKHLSASYEPSEIVEKMMSMLPCQRWEDEHLVITGGEPLLKWQNIYPELLSHPKMQDLKEITFETNGTQPLTPEFRQYLLDWVLNPQYGKRGHDALTFSVSAKLSCSGEPRERAIRPSVVCEYQEVGYTYLKFVVATEEDVEEAVETLDIYRGEGFQGPCYLMAEGGVEHKHILNKERVATLAMKNGLRYSGRLQVDLFKNAWNT